MKAATRLDRFISKHSQFSIGNVRLLLAQGRIWVDGELAQSIGQRVGPFTKVVLDEQVLNDSTPVYLMLNKPKGVVSATKDEKHKTVIDLIDHPQKDQLHIVGRLDFNTTGLVLLTNDGGWSRAISTPSSKLAKIYHVTVEQPITAQYVATFQEGIYFSYEDITTLPAELTQLSSHTALLSIVEGKYHQVKRMFGYFQNEVLQLHRQSVGEIQLGNLPIGQSRALTAQEINLIKPKAK